MSSALERRLAGQQAVERGAQAVDVGPRAQPVQLAPRLLGAHVGRRAQRAARQGLRRAARRRGDGLLADRRIGPADALARPQSTTSVSPCLPTMMFAGLMSRWITPREWA